MNPSTDSKCIIGSKTFYFGLGGGLFELQEFLKVENKILQLKCEVNTRLNDLKSIERVICVVKHGLMEEASQASEDDFKLEF